MHSNAPPHLPAHQSYPRPRAPASRTCTSSPAPSRPASPYLYVDGATAPAEAEAGGGLPHGEGFPHLTVQLGEGQEHEQKPLHLAARDARCILANLVGEGLGPPARTLEGVPLPPSQDGEVGVRILRLLPDLHHLLVINQLVVKNVLDSTSRSLDQLDSLSVEHSGDVDASELLEV